MNATVLCFKTGMVLKPDQFPRPRDHYNKERAECPQREVNRVGHWKYMVDSIERRYGDKLPKQGCIYKQRLNSAVFDSYGYGNVHDSVHQWRGGRYWNKPMPMPADLDKIEKYLKRCSGKVLRLGYKSDPFMWMDHKYQITKSVLEIANENNVKIVIHTMSDLCGHYDYVELLKNHKVIIHMGFKAYGEVEFYEYQEEIERLASPGGPSIKRREKAYLKLSDAGIEVAVEYNEDLDLLRKLASQINRRGAR